MPPPPVTIVSPRFAEESVAPVEAVRVFCGTWNLHGSEPEGDLSAWLRVADGGAARPDVVAVGTQEAERSIQASVVRTSKARWQATLEAALGSDYACVGSQTLVAIHLAVFVRTPLMPYVSGVQSAHAATGLMGGTLGNKGGVAVAFNLKRTSFIFVNAHFAAHQKNVEQRNADFAKIDAQLRLTPLPATAADAAAAGERGSGPDAMPVPPVSAPVHPTRDSSEAAFPPPRSALPGGRPTPPPSPPDVSDFDWSDFEDDDADDAVDALYAAAHDDDDDDHQHHHHHRTPLTPHRPHRTPLTPPLTPPPSPPVADDDDDSFVAPPAAVRFASDSVGSEVSADENASGHATSDATNPSPPWAARSVSADSAGAPSSTARFDRAFFMGDFNYRIDASREEVDKLLEPPDAATKALPTWTGDADHWETVRAQLLRADQLLGEMARGKVFGGWAEGAIHFRPTYKFDKKQKDAYDQSEKRRIPAYTDRVLWRPTPPDWPVAMPVPVPPDAEGGEASAAAVPAADAVIRLQRYDAVPSLCFSDHKPVFAEFDVSITGYAPDEDGRARTAHRPHHRLARSGSRASMSNVQRPPPTRQNSVRNGTPKSPSAAQSSVCTVM